MFRFFRSKKQAKMQWIRNSSQSNADNLNNVRRDANIHFRNKKNEYLKAKIEVLETNRKIKNIRDLYRGMNHFKKGYEPRINIVKNEKGDLVADCEGILARWRNHFSQLLNVRGVSNFGHTKIHTAKTLVRELCIFVFEMAIGKIKKKTHITRYRSNPNRNN